MKPLLLSFHLSLALALAARADEIFFSKDRFFSNEFSRKASVTLERTGSIAMPVAVRVTATGDTAVAGADFDPFDRFVTIAAGESLATIEIPLPDDALSEPDEFFKLTISDLPPGATSPRSETTVVINDYEGPGSIDAAWTSALGLTPDEMARGWPLTVIPIRDGQLIVTVAVYDEDLMWIEKVLLLRLNPDASIDHPVRVIEPSADGNSITWVEFVSLPDDSVVVKIEEIVPGSNWVHSHVHFRLRADGSIDESFPEITSIGYPIGMTAQPDGKLLVYCGSGALAGGATQMLFVRLHRDGSVDDSFAPVSDILGNLDFTFWLLADGSLLLGAWSGAGGTYQLRRLHADGSPDPSFQPPSGLISSGTIPRVFPLTNGQTLNFSYPNLRRLRHDGSIDPQFSGLTGLAPGTPGVYGSGVDRVKELEGGRFLLLGTFRKYNGVTVNGIVRILPNGAIDPEFRSGQGFEWSIDPTASFIGPGDARPLSGARFLMGQGSYDRYDGQPVTPPIVINADGTRDTSFAASELASIVALIGDQPIVWTPDGLSRLNPPLAAELPAIASIDRDDLTIRFTVDVRPGRRYTLEASSDLAQWIDVETRTATTPRIEFTDAAGLGTARRFYRVQEESE